MSSVEPGSEMANAAEDPALAKSANSQDFKPAVVPDSDPTDADTNNDPLSNAEGSTKEETATRGEGVIAEDDGDHVVEGDEDTVIY